MSMDTSIKSAQIISCPGKAMNATLSNSTSSSSEDSSDGEGNFIASTTIAEAGDGNSGESSNVDDKEDIVSG